MKPTIRCSGLDRRLNCPGSATLEQKLRDETLDLGGVGEGDAMTWRGNWCHYESAMRLHRDQGAVIQGILPPPVLPAGWQPTPWDERLVEWYLANLLADTPEDHAFFVESYYEAEFERFKLTGHLDVHTMNPDCTAADIDDLKSGENMVDAAEENWQLLGYAILLKRRYPTLKHVRARIFQRSAEIPITEVLIDFDDGVDLQAFLERKINAALDNAYCLETGYKQCRLCPCVDFCPAIYLELEHMKMILSEEEVANLKVVPDLKVLAATAAAGRAVAGPIEHLLQTLKDRIELEGPTQLPDGTPVRIVEAPGRRNVTHVNAAFIVVASKIGEDAAWDTLSLSLTEVEDKLVDTGMKRTSKKTESAKGWIDEHMNHLITRPTIKKLVFN